MIWDDEHERRFQENADAVEKEQRSKRVLKLKTEGWPGNNLTVKHMVSRLSLKIDGTTWACCDMNEAQGRVLLKFLKEIYES